MQTPARAKQPHAAKPGWEAGSTVGGAPTGAGRVPVEVPLCPEGLPSVEGELDPGHSESSDTFVPHVVCPSVIKGCSPFPPPNLGRPWTALTNAMWPERHQPVLAQGLGGLVTSTLTFWDPEPPTKEETAALLERPCGETGALQPPAVPASQLWHHRARVSRWASPPNPAPVAGS